MVVQFKEEVEEIPNSAGPNDEIDGFWPDEYDNDASVSFLDMFGNDADKPDDSFFKALDGNIDDDYFAQYFPSSKLAFDEKADSDIRGMLDDFHVCLEELSLDTYEIAFDVGSSNEDSQLSCDCSSE